MCGPHIHGGTAGLFLNAAAGDFSLSRKRASLVLMAWPSLGGLTSPFVWYPGGCLYCRTGRVGDGPDMSCNDLKVHESQRPSDTRRASPWPTFSKPNFDSCPDLSVKSEGAVSDCVGSSEGP